MLIISTHKFHAQGCGICSLLFLFSTHCYNPKKKKRERNKTELSKIMMITYNCDKPWKEWNN